MTTSVPRPGQLHDEVYVYPAAVSAALAVLAAGGPNLFTLEPTLAELAAVRAGSNLVQSPPRRTAFLIGRAPGSRRSPRYCRRFASRKAVSMSGVPAPSKTPRR